MMWLIVDWRMMVDQLEGNRDSPLEGQSSINPQDQLSTKVLCEGATLRATSHTPFINLLTHFVNRTSRHSPSPRATIPSYSTLHIEASMYWPSICATSKDVRLSCYVGADDSQRMPCKSTSDRTYVPRRGSPIISCEIDLTVLTT